MARKSITKRIRITKKGKLARRARGLSHTRTNKKTNQLMRRRGGRNLVMSAKNINKFL